MDYTGRMESPADIRGRVEMAMKHRGFSQSELARRAGCTRQGINSLLSGHSSGRELMHKLGEALGVSPYWLLTGEARAPDWLNTAMANDPAAPYVIDLETPRDLPVIAYAGASSDGQRGVILERPENKRLSPDLALVAVRGQSAYPAIYEGQYAIVNTRRQVRHNNVVAVVLAESGDVLVKRWVPQPDSTIVVLASLDGGRDSISVHIHDIRHCWPVVGVLYE
jgi:phage repressor protein C with HTH and peptisase S24 domain